MTYFVNSHVLEWLLFKRVDSRFGMKNGWADNFFFTLVELNLLNKWIVVTLSQIIWHQTEFRLVPNQLKSVITMFKFKWYED